MFLANWQAKSDCCDTPGRRRGWNLPIVCTRRSQGEVAIQAKAYLLKYYTGPEFLGRSPGIRSSQVVEVTLVHVFVDRRNRSSHSATRPAHPESQHPSSRGGYPRAGACHLGSGGRSPPGYRPPGVVHRFARHHSSLFSSFEITHSWCRSGGGEVDLSISARLAVHQAFAAW